MAESDLSWIPSVDALLRTLPPVALPRPMIVSVVRAQLAKLRCESKSSDRGDVDVQASVLAALRTLERSRLQPVINATGVILHTNLGRAPLASSVADAVYAAATQYCSIEFDLRTGERGSRAGYLESLLACLCGAEASTVVNNCAAALMLIVRRLTAGERKRVIISRGEMVQIGGGFRVPDILQTSGATLCEVGTTNQTSLNDYRQAIGDDVAMILKVHRSNFFMDGFVDSPTTAALAAVAREAGVPLVEDIGSGAVFDTQSIPDLPSEQGPPSEPTPSGTIAAGADLVCFSGDKLFGGPQAGIIAGTATRIAALKIDPIFRALRCDKLVLTALQATTELLLQGQPPSIPARTMMTLSVTQLRSRAKQIIAAAHTGSVVETIARVGGGSLPQLQIPSIGIAFRPRGAAVDSIAKQLRDGKPPIIATIHRDQIIFDLRTVFPHQDQHLMSTISQLSVAADRSI